jgi:serine phosphatase RsbU (regulator of sigma subunit)
LNSINLNFDIEESLLYSEFLQKAIYPKQRHFDRVFRDSFVLFKPLYFVSGDFFWLSEVNGLTYIVVCDCAGHGVPGAILSVLMYSLLDYAILNKKLKKTQKIAREIDKRFIESFCSAESQKPFDNDWVDVSICCIEKEINTIYFTGCKRDLLHISGGKMNLYKGDSNPIGGWKIDENRCFKSVGIKYQAGDCLYLGTDGFQDQIGGEDSKKFKKKQLHNLLLQNSKLPMSLQKEKLEEELDQWMRGNGQTDDICVIGIRL